MVFSMNVSVIMDIVVVVFLLIFAVIGFAKGFFRGLVDLGGVILAFVIAINLGSLLANGLQSFFGLRDTIGAALENWLLSIEGFDTVLTEEGISAALEKIGIPSFICAPIAESAAALVQEQAGLTIAQALSTIFASYLLSFLCGILVFILCRLFLKLLAKLLTKIVDKIPFVGLLNRILGFVLGLLIGIIYLYIVLSVLSVVPSEPLQQTLQNTVIIQFLYHHNLLMLFLNAISFFEKIFTVPAVTV